MSMTKEELLEKFDWCIEKVPSVGTYVAVEQLLEYIDDEDVTKAFWRVTKACGPKFIIR